MDLCVLCFCKFTLVLTSVCLPACLPVCPSLHVLQRRSRGIEAFGQFKGQPCREPLGDSEACVAIASCAPPSPSQCLPGNFQCSSGDGFVDNKKCKCWVYNSFVWLFVIHLLVLRLINKYISQWINHTIHKSHNTSHTLNTCAHKIGRST